MNYSSDIPAATNSAPPTGEVAVNEDPEIGIDAIPGLVRMVLVDTKLFPGAIAEVPLDGNTLVTGTNAAGKTSIIQLLPLFYGVSPSKISKKSQGKNFYGHYLPRSTSYVAFEYRHRDGGRRSIIVHAAPSDDKPLFRFVRSGLFENMFVDDHNEFVIAVNLASHLRGRGYDVAERIISTLSDYQTIIQGHRVRKGNTADQRFMAQMVAQYASNQHRYPLQNMDRVVYSMLKKDVSLQALEEMIAEKILEDDAEMQIDGDRQNLENWPARYRAYQAVMKEEENARRVDRQCVELEAHQKNRRDALAELQALRTTLMNDEASERGRLDDAVSTLKDERDDYLERKEQAHEVTTAALIAKHKIIDDIDEIETREKNGRSGGIESKVALADRKGQIEADREEARARLGALTGAYAELNRTYENLKIEARDAADGEVEVIRSEESAARQDHRAKLEAAKARHQRAEDALRQEHEEPIAQAEGAMDEALSALGAAQEAAKSPQVSQETLNRRDEAQRTLTARSAELTASLRDEKRLADEVRARETARAAVTKSISHLEEQVAALRDNQTRLEASRKPEPGSLLAHLRENREDWGDTIGRVINPELLYRNDLDPSEVPFEDGLFGLGLDLARVDPVDEADLSEIDAAIEAAKAEVAEMEEEIAQARVRQAKAEDEHAKARRALSDHQGRQAVLDQGVKAADATLRAREEDVSSERKRAGEIALERVETAKAELARAKDARTAAKELLRAALAELSASNAAEIEAIEAALEEALTRFGGRESDVRRRLDARHKELDEELAEALSSKGVDPSLMQDLKARIKRMEDDLSAIRRDEGQVQSWRHFVAAELPKLPGLRSRLAQAEITHTNEQAKENRLKTEWQAREAALKEEVAAAEAQVRRLGEIIRKTDERLARTDDVAEIPPAVTLVRGYDEIVAALNDAEQKAKTLESRIRQDVIRISKVFLDEPGSPAEQHLSGRRAQFSSTVEGPEWVPALIEWFDTLHQQHRDNLLGDGRTITNNIKNAYFRLVDLDKQIQAENRALQASLDKNNVITVVQDLNVGIASSIKKLDFMPAMKRLSELHERWVRSGQVEPPEGFTDAMTNLLAFWRGRDGITANLRNQIRIEGYIVENGNRRDFHARTDLTDISSNGVSYLVLTTILVGFVNMVRGKAPLHVVWALDELGNIDAFNTRRLLDMLRENHITLVAATPAASASVNRLFDYRVKVIDGPRLADIRGAGRPSQRLLASPEAAGQLELRKAAAREGLAAGSGGPQVSSQTTSVDEHAES